MLFSRIVNYLLQPETDCFVKNRCQRDDFIHLRQNFPFFDSFQPRDIHPDGFGKLLLAHLLIFSELVNRQLEVDLQVVFLIKCSAFNLDFLKSIRIFLPNLLANLSAWLS